MSQVWFHTKHVCLSEQSLHNALYINFTLHNVYGSAHSGTETQNGQIRETQ